MYWTYIFNNFGLCIHVKKVPFLPIQKGENGKTNKQTMGKSEFKTKRKSGNLDISHILFRYNTFFCTECDPI